MARNRKRAKERHRSESVTARPGDLLSPSSRRPTRKPGSARNPASNAERDRVGPDRTPEPVDLPADDLTGAEPLVGPDVLGFGDPISAPDPIAHAAPDAELAAARLALGAADLQEDGDIPDEAELDELAAGSAQSTRRGARSRRAPANGDGALAAPVERAPAHRVSTGTRLVTFLRGSWAELQRVQWPDRRQVMQATGVVIGFVIVAGVFLGLSDLASEHLMTWILK